MASNATRTATITRTTSETAITLTLSLDGAGQSRIATGVGFLDHMLTALARHALFDLEIEATGDLHIDDHHTTEDVGIVLGQALARALGEKRGIRRFGHAVVPMDEALVEAAVDLSGRPFLVWSVAFGRDKVGTMDTELFEEFFRALAMNALMALHVTEKAGSNAHHVAEGCFKAVARALREATEPDPRTAGVVPSTKAPCDGVGMNTWTAHIKPARPPVLVKEAFSWGAFLFGPLWLLTRRAWIPAALHLALLIALVALLPPAMRGIALLATSVLAGLTGRDLVRWSLERRGYVLCHVLAGRDEEAALGRLLTARPELVASAAGLPA